MGKRVVEVDVPIQVDRHFPAEAFLAAAKAIEASGVVDYIQGWDQLTSWWPERMWTPENTPLYAVRPDCDSFPDFVSMLSASAALSPNLGTVISLDSVRRGPAELMQTMLTMANLTKGRAQFHFGAGELKQCKPFGYKRSQGLGRLEDLLKIFKLFWENDEPFSYEGKYWTMDQAAIGYAKPYRPQVWGLGGGPKLIDLATSYADGFATMVPFVAYSPERWHEMVTSMKQQLERKGRDPEAFSFGLYGANLIHEDEAVVEESLENPLIKFCTGIMGRIIQSDWEREGIEPPVPPDWHYATKLLPLTIPQTEIDAILQNVTPVMSQKSWIKGTPAQVAAEFQGYIDAGATWISIIDVLPSVLPPDEAAAALGTTLDVARRLKDANGGVPTGAALSTASAG